MDQEKVCGCAIGSFCGCNEAAELISMEDLRNKDLGRVDLYHKAIEDGTEKQFIIKQAYTTFGNKDHNDHQVENGDIQDKQEFSSAISFWTRGGSTKIHATLTNIDAGNMLINGKMVASPYGEEIYDGSIFLMKNRLYKFTTYVTKLETATHQRGTETSRIPLPALPLYPSDRKKPTTYPASRKASMDPTKMSFSQEDTIAEEMEPTPSPVLKRWHSENFLNLGGKSRLIEDKENHVQIKAFIGADNKPGSSRNMILGQAAANTMEDRPFSSTPEPVARIEKCPGKVQTAQPPQRRVTRSMSCAQPNFDTEPERPKQILKQKQNQNCVNPRRSKRTSNTAFNDVQPKKTVKVKVNKDQKHSEVKPVVVGKENKPKEEYQEDLSSGIVTRSKSKLIQMLAAKK